jgi:uncharacterized repeat protein (TIGR02543 family)
MAAPSGITWGSIVDGNSENVTGRRGRIGIYTKVSNTNAETTVNVQVWFWTIYSCRDGAANKLYYDVGTGVTSASTVAASNITINHTVSTGSAWNTANQTKLLDKTYKYSREKTAKTYKIYAKFSGIDMMSGPASHNVSFTVPALPSYTVSFNANGGSKAPDSQKKWYGETLTLTSSEPTRTGYTFQGWALSDADADAGKWYYSAGGSCGKNENLTLYAVWKIITYAVKFDANGGTGAPGNQTKTYGVTLKLSSTKPTRANYDFLGWSTSKTATTEAYSAGGNYTANSAATLYAVWKLAYKKPRVTNLSVVRCTSDGTIDDSGTYAKVTFNWATDKTVSGVVIEYFTSGETTVSTRIQVEGTSGSVNRIVGENKLSIDKSYTVRIIVKDAVDSSSAVRTLNGYKFIRDFYSKGEGVAWGKPAELRNVFDIGFKTRLLGGLLYVVLPSGTDINECVTPGFYVSKNLSTDNIYANCPFTSGTFTLEVLSMGDGGQTLQRVTVCSIDTGRAYERIKYGSGNWGEWVCVSDYSGKLLWSGSWYMNETQTAELSEAVSAQRTGIVLVFSLYDAEASTYKNQEMFEFFIPKYSIAKHNGNGRNFNLCGMFGNSVKYLYLHDDKVVGHDKNDASMTVGGIEYDNKRYVLRYVIGV